jgi:hypothetical protein
MAADLGGVKQQIEQELARNTAGADPADVEEMLAILTASTRSYERKLAKSGSEPDISEYIATLGHRYVADEGLLDAAQWQQVADSVAAATAGAAQVRVKRDRHHPHKRPALKEPHITHKTDVKGAPRRPQKRGLRHHKK